MKILVYEYSTGGGGSSAPFPSLVREGDAMLTALIRDLVEVPGVTVSALRDARLPKPVHLSPLVEWISVSPGDNVMERYLSAMRDCDAVWPIGPETQGVLQQLCMAAECSQKPLLNTSSQGVAIAASKRLTHERLSNQGVPVVSSMALDLRGGHYPDIPMPFVVKADDGVACENTHIIQTHSDWEHFVQTHDNGVQNWIIQPYTPGESLSLSAVFAQGEAVLLTCNRQHIRQLDAHFLLEGCTVNAFNDETARVSELLKHVASAFPELWGYAGVDFIVNQQGVFVLEVNPRLTSSYPGIRDALGLNPSSLIIELLQTRCLPKLPMAPSRPVEVMWGLH